MRKYSLSRRFVVGVIILVVAITLPRYVKTLRLDRRIQNALSFPAEGYSKEHDSLVLEAVVRVYNDTGNSERLSLLVEVILINAGESTFKDVIAAAKTDHLEKYCYHGIGAFRVRMLEPVTLESGKDPPASLSFSWSTPLRALDQEELDQLASELAEPLLIKVIHNDGTELMLVKPDVRIDI